LEPIRVESTTPQPRNPCHPSPCGSNAKCEERNGAGACICLPEYFGDPYTGCRPECVLNPDCPSNKACVSNKCVDPCPGLCGYNAECSVRNHVASCGKFSIFLQALGCSCMLDIFLLYFSVCRDGFEGDPFSGCAEKREFLERRAIICSYCI
jgi:hypothetical protein